MSYPDPPNFRSGDPTAETFDAWWSFARDDGRVNVCATSGAALVADLKQSFGLPEGAHEWGTTLLQQMLSTAHDLSSLSPGWEPLLAALDTDVNAIAGSPISLATLTFGIWLAYYRPVGLRLDALTVSPSSVMPLKLIAPPGPRQALACWDSTSDSPAQNLSASRLADARASTVNGVRLRPGEAPPSLPATAPPPSGVSGVTVVLVVVGLGVAAYGAYALISRAKSQVNSTPKGRT